MVCMAKRKNPPDPQNPMANCLRQAVADAGLSMLQVSKRAGIPYKCAHAFIVGYGDVMLATASKIADVVGLELRPVKPKRR